MKYWYITITEGHKMESHKINVQYTAQYIHINSRNKALSVALRRHHNVIKPKRQTIRDKDMVTIQIRRASIYEVWWCSVDKTILPTLRPGGSK